MRGGSSSSGRGHDRVGHQSAEPEMPAEPVPTPIHSGHLYVLGAHMFRRRSQAASSTEARLRTARSRMPRDIFWLMTKLTVAMGSTISDAHWVL